ncbi:MAG: UDP-N-acetylmuramate:L-alanyl-gamma-D-glutamyl-meso-diaminopimelate ligase [Acidobacteria bacterium]|nr:MAG: UDP-N-acetylmuramate:L-alanyl-gamma-D-glutamyl-meso-diaminopimelate ligase [Acidobacteriota bacterium]REJ99234.1 MAG: UDP-N-acetylmuramate:L-alanyl-gamma-D-glutamyl-meso-diaminopimelate ligase [Acidobacteriota bacterium]REK16045.1 MAG: UDP-N-acetylmuramate:L-alanyl-gamma-D-glutamyl-meso-diaminopimelate ligase [Acidobacteriota bacterium]REK43726.1 MAG: UDP-N-acetylmuramate:L-alanyl-gamma-D-glutamyl-meso-diaminopimelate ligase [Acidobacteriota bacterium]
MHYHLIGICGTAMGSLAGMLQSRGHKITGSDQNVYPPMSTQLESLGIELMQGYNPANLDVNADLIIVGNTIKRGNPELEALLNRRLPYYSQAETVKREFIRGKRSLVVGGTHGKTTTTSIATWVLETAGLDPSFLVGGVVQNFGSSFRVSDSDFFVIEGDEYDSAYFDKKPKFMHYLPEVAIVGNIEFDHADIYRDLTDIKFQFSRLMNLVPGNGRVVAGIDSPHVREVLEEHQKNLHTEIHTFGTSADALWQAQNLDFSGERTRFSVSFDGDPWGEFETDLIGEFNVRNCLAVIAAADQWGVDAETIQKAFDTFKSVKRRAEVRGIESGVTVIDDFAHHPTAVGATLEALRQRYRGKRIIAVFEPRSWSSRLAVFQEPYVDAFAKSDYAIVAGVYDSSAASKVGKILDTGHLVEDINLRGVKALSLADADEIVDHLTPEMREGDIVAVMSNGGFGNIHEKLLDALKQKD